LLESRPGRCRCRRQVEALIRHHPTEKNRAKADRRTKLNGQWRRLHGGARLRSSRDGGRKSEELNRGDARSNARSDRSARPNGKIMAVSMTRAADLQPRFGTSPGQPLSRTQRRQAVVWYLGESSFEPPKAGRLRFVRGLQYGRRSGGERSIFTLESFCRAFATQSAVLLGANRP